MGQYLGKLKKELIQTRATRDKKVKFDMNRLPLFIGLDLDRFLRTFIAIQKGAPGAPSDSDKIKKGKKTIRSKLDYYVKGCVIN